MTSSFRRGLAAGGVLAAVAAASGYMALRAYRAPGPLEVKVSVVVPRGAFSGVADILQEAGVVEHASVLRLYEAVTARFGAIHAAELSFPARASISEVLFVLRHGRPVQHLLTIPEGLTGRRVGEILAGAAGLSGVVRLPQEGEFLPETYAYLRGDLIEAVAERARSAMSDALAQAWRGRSAGAELESPAALLVLASMVERETHLSAERPLVAAVFLNRLRLRMRLQSDPTVVYGASGGGSELPAGLQRDQLGWDTPYNTYLHTGLPAGPICNPGTASIWAAAHPARTAALYFVADGSGGHVFAATLGEHLRNVERYRLLKH